MDTSVLVALITTSGSILIGSLSFYLTKRYQIKKEWQKEKIDHYKLLISAISDLAIDGKNKDEANRKFSMAVNTIALVAPQSVIMALMEFHDEVKFTNPNPTIEKQTILLKKLLLEIRKDIDLGKEDKEESFIFHLVGSSPKK